MGGSSPFEERWVRALSTARGSGHARQRLRDKGDDCGLVVADCDDELLLLLLGWRPVGGGRQLLLTVTCVEKEARRGTVMLYNAKDICWGVVFVGTVRFKKRAAPTVETPQLKFWYLCVCVFFLLGGGGSTRI